VLAGGRLLKGKRMRKFLVALGIAAAALVGLGSATVGSLQHFPYNTIEASVA
jgi:hypothetical protein